MANNINKDINQDNINNNIKKIINFFDYLINNNIKIDNIDIFIFKHVLNNYNLLNNLKNFLNNYNLLNYQDCLEELTLNTHKKINEIINMNDYKLNS